MILATGYRPRVDAFLQGACNATGASLSSGSETPFPGLYFCGYRVAATGMLREIAREARRIGAVIAKDGPAVPAGDGWPPRPRARVRDAENLPGSPRPRDQ